MVTCFACCSKDDTKISIMKATILTGLSVLANIVLYAQFVTSASPGSFSNIAIPGSSASWVNTNNASASDDNYTIFGDIAGSPGSYTDYLAVTQFGLSIPLGATVVGIKVEIECSDTKS